jgi:hypothetical protein
MQIEAFGLCLQRSARVNPLRIGVSTDALQLGPWATTKGLPARDRPGISTRQHRRLIVDWIAVDVSSSSEVAQHTRPDGFNELRNSASVGGSAAQKESSPFSSSLNTPSSTTA